MRAVVLRWAELRLEFLSAAKPRRERKRWIFINWKSF